VIDTSKNEKGRGGGGLLVLSGRIYKSEQLSLSLSLYLATTLLGIGF